MVNSLSLGSLASTSYALPCAAIFSGGRNLTASPACQFGLPPGPAVAREIVFSHFPPVRLACDSALAVIDLPQPEKTALVAPADPKIFKSVRRSVVVLCSDMDSTPWVSASRLVQGFSICSLEALFRHPSSESRKPSNRAVLRDPVMVYQGSIALSMSLFRAPCVDDGSSRRKTRANFECSSGSFHFVRTGTSHFAAPSSPHGSEAPLTPLDPFDT